MGSEFLTVNLVTGVYTIWGTEATYSVSFVNTSWGEGGEIPIFHFL